VADDAKTSAGTTALGRLDLAPTWVGIGAAVGVLAALTGFIDGVVLMVKRKVASCPNGHYFPAGTKNFNCYAHPRLAAGLAISSLSLGVGVIVLLLAFVVVAVLRGQGPATSV
jgi:hypothetical protein